MLLFRRKRWVTAKGTDGAFIMDIRALDIHRGKNTMNFSFEQTQYVGILSFQGSLTKVHASEVMEILMVSWEKTPSIIIDLAQVTEIDGACLQIFCRAYRLALMTNKLFALSAISSPAWEQISENPSICCSECHHEFPLPGLPLNCIKDCLWGIKGGF